MRVTSARATTTASSRCSTSRSPGRRSPRRRSGTSRTASRRQRSENGVARTTRAGRTSPGRSTPGEQAAQLAAALRLAHCQPRVAAFFNFLLVDERLLAGWQSGLLWADWRRKPAFEAYRAAITEIRSGTVDCAGGAPGLIAGHRPACQAHHDGVQAPRAPVDERAAATGRSRRRRAAGRRAPARGASSGPGSRSGGSARASR